MNTTDQNLEALQDIRKMMERSGRFISLSGWSGIAAGACALIGAWLANQRIRFYYGEEYNTTSGCPTCLKKDLILISICVFLGAFISATLFTFIKSKKEGVAIWGNAARRLLWNTLLPMIAGGFLIWRMMELKHYELIASSSLIFYGLALINGSKYTMGEVRYLGYAQIITGLFCLWSAHAGLECWAFGFGVLHIVYGVAMWWKYDRKSTN
jgi:hypothetical protein